MEPPLNRLLIERIESMKHICMVCREDIDPNHTNSVLKTNELGQTGFVHYECQDTFTPEILGSTEG